MTRPPIPIRMKFDAIFHCAIVVCHICKDTLEPGQDIDWDHYIPFALGGEHHHENLRPVHRGCHRTKTFGRKATSAGSDIHAIAKTKRIPGKMRVSKPPAGTRKPETIKRKWPSRPMQRRRIP